MKSSNSLEHIYTSHHNERRGAFFVLQGEVRGPFLKEKIGTGKKVLDIGCRDGALTTAYAQGNDVLGLDIDPEALKRAADTLGIKTQQVDLNGDWPIAENSFDAVVAAEVLEHIYYPEAVLKKIHAVLKPGGLLVGSVPNAFSLRNRLTYLFGIKKNTPMSDPTHINHFTRKELEGYLRKQFSSFKVYPMGRFLWLDRIFPGLFSFMMMFEARK